SVTCVPGMEGGSGGEGELANQWERRRNLPDALFRPVLMPLVPRAEPLAAIRVQCFVIGEVQLPVLRQRLVELAPIVGMVATDLRTLFIDAAASARLQVPAGGDNEQVPAAFVLEELDVVVGNLPEHEIEVVLRTRGF